MKSKVSMLSSHCLNTNARQPTLELTYLCIYSVESLNSIQNEQWCKTIRILLLVCSYSVWPKGGTQINIYKGKRIAMSHYMAVCGSFCLLFVSPQNVL